MLFPSHDEGWGLPIVESLALGTPVICSDLPVHRECSQGVGVFIDQLDGLQWLRTIEEVASGEKQLSAAGYIPITWPVAQAKMVKIIETYLRSESL